MEQQLREHLKEDEQLLWSGRPEAFETLDRTNRSGIITGLVIKALVSLAILAAYIIAVQRQGSFSPGVVVIILAFAAFALASPFLTARRLRRKTIYGLTDKRIMRYGSFEGAVPYERIRSAVLRTDEDGHTSLLCGPKTVGLEPRKWRSQADAPFINSEDDPEAVRVLLYAVPMSDGFKEILEKHLTLK